MSSYLRRRSFLAGPLGGSRQWTLLWAVLLGLRLVRRLSRHEPEVVFREELKRGESLVISGTDREPTIVGG